MCFNQCLPSHHVSVLNAQVLDWSVPVSYFFMDISPIWMPLEVIWKTISSDLLKPNCWNSLWHSVSCREPFTSLEVSVLHFKRIFFNINYTKGKENVIHFTNVGSCYHSWLYSPHRISIVCPIFPTVDGCRAAIIITLKETLPVVSRAISQFASKSKLLD